MAVRFSRTLLDLLETSHCDFKAENAGDGSTHSQIMKEAIFWSCTSVQSKKQTEEIERLREREKNLHHVEA